MRHKHINQAGFGKLEVLLVVIMLVIVGLVGLDAAKHKKSGISSTAQTSSNKAVVLQKSTSVSASTSGDGNAAIENSLSAAEHTNSHSIQDLSNTNSSLKDQSTLVTVP